MHIFRLPAHLNAKRFPWQCFRYLLTFSNPSVFYYRPPSSPRPALLTVSRPAQPCLFPFPVSSHLIASHLVLVPPFSPFLSPSNLFPPDLLSNYPVAAIIAPPVVSCGGACGGTSCCGSLRSAASSVALPVSVAFPRRAKLAPSIVLSCGEGGGEEGEPCPCRLCVCAVSV